MSAPVAPKTVPARGGVFTSIRCAAEQRSFDGGEQVLAVQVVPTPSQAEKPQLF